MILAPRFGQGALVKLQQPFQFGDRRFCAGGDEPSLGALSLSTMKQPLSAAARAAEAAARIPEPPPRTPKAKLKTVSWQEESQLVFVRLFNKVCLLISYTF